MDHIELTQLLVAISVTLTSVAAIACCCKKSKTQQAGPTLVGIDNAKTAKEILKIQDRQQRVAANKDKYLEILREKQRILASMAAPSALPPQRISHQRSVVIGYQPSHMGYKPSHMGYQPPPPPPTYPYPYPPPHQPYYPPAADYGFGYSTSQYAGVYASQQVLPTADLYAQGTQRSSPQLPAQIPVKEKSVANIDPKVTVVKEIPDDIDTEELANLVGQYEDYEVINSAEDIQGDYQPSAPIIRLPEPPISRTSEPPIIRSAEPPIIRSAEPPIIRSSEPEKKKMFSFITSKKVEPEKPPLPPPRKQSMGRAADGRSRHTTLYETDFVVDAKR